MPLKSGKSVGKVAIAGSGALPHPQHPSRVVGGVGVEAIQRLSYAGEARHQFGVGLCGCLKLAVNRIESLGLPRRLGGNPLHHIKELLLPGSCCLKLIEQSIGQLPLVVNHLGKALQQLRQLAHAAHQLFMLIELQAQVIVDLLKLIDQAVETFMNLLGRISTIHGRHRPDRHGASRQPVFIIGGFNRGVSVKPVRQKPFFIQRRPIAIDAFISAVA